MFYLWTFPSHPQVCQGSYESHVSLLSRWCHRPPLLLKRSSLLRYSIPHLTYKTRALRPIAAETRRSTSDLNITPSFLHRYAVLYIYPLRIELSHHYWLGDMQLSGRDIRACTKHTISPALLQMVHINHDSNQLTLSKIIRD